MVVLQWSLPKTLSRQAFMGTSAATPMEPGQRGVLAQGDLGPCKPGARTLGPCNSGPTRSGPMSPTRSGPTKPGPEAWIQGDRACGAKGHLAWPVEPGSPGAYVPKGTRMLSRIRSKVVQVANIDVQMHGHAPEMSTADAFKQKNKPARFLYICSL